MAKAAYEKKKDSTWVYGPRLTRVNDGGAEGR